jgi:hypothetical protein
LRVFENKIPRRMSAPKTKEGTGWRKLHDEKGEKGKVVPVLN